MSVVAIPYPHEHEIRCALVEASAADNLAHAKIALLVQGSTAYIWRALISCPGQVLWRVAAKPETV